MYYKKFTLTEVVLALGVVAVGMVGVLALFPVGLKSNKNAIGDYYSSSLAEQAFHLIENQAFIYDGNGEYVTATDDLDVNGVNDFDGWGEWITGRGGYFDNINIVQLSDSAPDEANLDIGKVIADPNKIPLFDGIGIYQDADTVGINNGVFYVESKTGDVLDWNGVMYIWKEQVMLDTDGNGVADSPISYDSAVQLCAEISWPFDKPYEHRQKRVYVLELYNKVAR